ncbi:ABC transporter substrate-binding protein [Marinihelvus fidelis]|uniref:ABC transporter substrate-binding protein n=1 Tax=Marinihelvus fidelis TaxID=2613842 RepID=A0A5N0T7P8_9GAMM|nr:ABC transporter substrate-binding protein [Marinihelvus fidelis]KAA9130922.1 ABC transporter substrate-binding protein [Marinihelvus fidelis]
MTQPEPTRRPWIAAALALFALMMVPVAAYAEDDPANIVRGAADRLIEQLDAQREQLKANPDIARRLVRDELLPIMDTVFSARLILGRAGRNATDKQVEDFAEALSTSLIDRYATGVVEYRDGDQMEVLPTRGDPNPRMTRVRTRVQLPDGKHLPVDYVFHKTDGGDWKAFDVIVEGISYVTTFRSQIMPQVEASGIEAVTARLRSGELALEE